MGVVRLHTDIAPTINVVVEAEGGASVQTPVEEPDQESPEAEEGSQK